MLFFKTKIIGNLGENVATKYLKKNKYKILKRNFSTKYGEIDIIAEKNGCICFVEVKTRRNMEYGEARDAVDIYKQKRIASAAKYYLLSCDNDKYCRFDVIEIYLENNKKVRYIEHIENAFWC